MPKRGENIHKRKDGRWEGRLKVGRHPNGATKYKSVYAKTYGEVKEKLNNARCSGLTPKKEPSGDSEFREVMDAWFNTSKFAMKGSTVYKYTYLMERHIEPQLGTARIGDITSGVISAFIEQKLRCGRLDGSGGLSTSYVKTMLYILQAVMSFAAGQELCLPPKIKLNLPARKRPGPPILSPEDQHRFEQYAVRKMGTTELGMLISLYAGLRIGEICALAWEDVDFKSRVIHVRQTVSKIKCEESESGRRTRLILDFPKTNASRRDIPISSLLMPYLVKARDTACSSYVVSDRPGFINPRTFTYRYRKVLEKCGLNSINYHALRHTFATRCMEAGVDIKSLSEILGHANVNCFWYGGIVSHMVYKGYHIYVNAVGDIVLNIVDEEGHFVTRMTVESEESAYGKEDVMEYIADDAEWKRLNNEGRIWCVNNNWLEWSIITPEGKVLPNCDGVFLEGDYVLDAIEGLSWYIECIEEDCRQL